MLGWRNPLDIHSLFNSYLPLTLMAISTSFSRPPSSSASGTQDCHTAALLFHTSDYYDFTLTELTAQFLVLLIGGNGTVNIDGQSTDLDNGTAYPFKVEWTGTGTRRVTSEIQCRIRVDVWETQTDLLVFFFNPQASRGKRKTHTKHPEDLLYDAARYSLSPFAKTALIQQWLIVDALLEHNVLLGLYSECRTTLPHLFSRIEFRPSSSLASFDTHLTGDKHQSLLINEAIGSFLAYLCRRVSTSKQEIFLREIRALLTAENYDLFRRSAVLASPATPWQSNSFWTDIVRGLSINNTPLWLSHAWQLDEQEALAERSD